MTPSSEAEPKILDKETLNSESAALGSMFSQDRAQGEISPEDDAAYKELIAENRDGFIALNKAGEATPVETIGGVAAPTSERARESALTANDDLKKAREAVMRQFGNIEDNWRVGK